MTRDDVRTVIGSALYPTDPDVAKAEAEAVLAALAAAGLVIGELDGQLNNVYPTWSNVMRDCKDVYEFSRLLEKDGLALVRVVA